MQTITIHTPTLTLAQFLKEAGIVGTGGAAKWYLAENEVDINGEADNRRGRKLTVGDVITLADGSTYKLVQE